MSKIEELIQRCGPIDRFALKDIVATKITDGMHNLPKGISSEGYAPILSAVNIHDGVIDYSTDKYVSGEIFDRENTRTNVLVGDILLTIVATIGRVAVVSNNIPFLLQRSVAVIKPNPQLAISKYVAYYLESDIIQDFMQSNARGAAQKGFYIGQVEELEIPLPPLSVQQEIVRILDSFTDLQRNLQQELDARKKQYEEYASKLMDNINAPMNTLNELGNFYGGLTGKSKDDFKDGNAKFITYMNVYSNPSLRIDVSDSVRISKDERQNTIQYGDILFTGSSETPDECGMSSVLTERTNEKLYLNSFSFGYRFNDISNIEPNFYKHLFRSKQIRSRIAKTANGVTRFNVSKKLFGKIEIPMPSVEKQRNIASTLDCFQEIILGIEREISLRQKQYEYYREKLLSFNQN